MKKLFYIFAICMVIGFIAVIASAAPSYTVLRSIMPEQATSEIGTSTDPFRMITVDWLCVNGSCSQTFGDFTASSFGSYFFTFFNGTTTDALSEGSNPDRKYWSNTLFDNRFISSIASTTADWGGTWQTRSPSYFFAISDWFSTTSAPHLLHNSLGSLQGGTAGSYYHSDQAINTTDSPSFAALTVSGTTTTDILCFDSAGTNCQTTPVIPGENITMFPWNGASDIAGYEQFRTVPDSGTELDESCAADSDIAGGYCLVDSYVSTSTLSAEGALSFRKIPPGIFKMDFFTYVDSSVGVTKIQSTIYRRNSAGTEFYVGQATSTEINNTSVAYTTFQFTNTSEITADPSDRLVAKVSCWTDSSVAKTCHFVYSGTSHYSSVRTPLTSASLAIGYLPSTQTWTGNNTFSASTTISGQLNFQQATGTQLTLSNSLWLSSLATPAGAYLAVNPSGLIISTTTPVSGSASSTLLTDNNTFSGTATFSSTLTGTLTGNADTATTLATARAINGVDFDGSAPITITAASSTSLTDNNTFTGKTTLATASSTDLSVSGYFAFFGEVWDSLASAVAWVRAQFTGGSHITITAGSIAVDDDFLLNNGDTGTGTYDFSGATVKMHKYPGFSWPAGAQNATTTTATTSVALGTAYVANTFSGSECWSGAGTVQYQISDGTNKTTTKQATTTASRFVQDTNNTFTAGEKRFIEIGPMTASYLSCSFDIVEN